MSLHKLTSSSANFDYYRVFGAGCTYEPFNTPGVDTVSGGPSPSASGPFTYATTMKIGLTGSRIVSADNPLRA